MVGLACGLKPEPVMVRRLNDGREVLSSDVITISDPEAIVMDAVPVLVESAALVAVRSEERARLMVRRLNDGREVLSSDVITISDPEAIVMDAVPVLVESAALVAV